MANREEASGVGRRLETLAATLSSDYQSLIIDIRKSLGLISGVAVGLEKEHQSDMVEKMDDAMLELLETCSDCTHYSSAIQAVSDGYRRPQENQLTDFNVILESEFDKVKRDFVSLPQNDPLYRKFKESVWNVHHAGQPLPGEEQEDIVMTSTQGNLLNIKCPLTGLHICDLGNPVRCKDCKHIYEKEAIMHYIKTKKSQPQCPVAGCPKLLQATRVVCDPMLAIEIDEARARGDETVEAQMVEDFGEGDSN